MAKHLVSEPLEAAGGSFDPDAMSRGEPSLPPAFHWRGEVLSIRLSVRTWRSTKTDRGDVYVKRHWFEVQLDDGRHATLYFERQAKRGQPRWWLYTVED
ncbi:MAG: DUF6504 family protein [Vulcanimicrobiaceae bacterium]